MADFISNDDKNANNIKGDKHHVDSNQFLTYQFTRDKSLINQYITLREKIYAQDLGLGGLLGGEDEYDKDLDSHSLVVLDGKEVIGGGRLTVSSPKRNLALPMEDDDFNLVELLPDLALGQCAYSEVDKIILEKPYRTKHNSDNIYIALNRFASERGVKYGFTQAPILQARSNKLICNRNGIKTEILNGISIPRKKYHGNLDQIVLSLITVNSISVNLMNGAKYES